MRCPLLFFICGPSLGCVTICSSDQFFFLPSIQMELLLRSQEWKLSLCASLIFFLKNLWYHLAVNTNAPFPIYFFPSHLFLRCAPSAKHWRGATCLLFFERVRAAVVVPFSSPPFLSAFCRAAFECIFAHSDQVRYCPSVCQQKQRKTLKKGERKTWRRRFLRRYLTMQS